MATQQEIIRVLDGLESQVHPQWGIPGTKLKSPGYHTQLADGQMVHPTRGAAYYSLLMLQSGESKWIARFGKVWETLLSFQETDSYKPTYGIWPWFCEEPLKKMAPPDWNWADFIGTQIAQILKNHRQAIGPAWAQRLGESLHHAAWSIFRRNVQPGYTNIALMGVAVTAAAGELLNEPDLLNYARRRIATFVEHTLWHGSFNEYNSPNYTLVAVDELDRMLYLVQDSDVRRDAEIMRRHAWTSIADHFHAPTATWAGPHSRTYDDHLSVRARRRLGRFAGAIFPENPASEQKPSIDIEQLDFDLFPKLDCLEDIKPRFRHVPSGLEQIQPCFVRAERDEDSVIGTTCFTPNANLSSINLGMFWTQTRPALGYWKTAGAWPAVLRLRMIKDGRDFASGQVRAAQKGNRILLSAGFLTNAGDYHRHLDRPPEPIFRCRQLVLRWELTAADATIASFNDGSATLQSGGVQARLHLPPASIADKPIAWRAGQEKYQYPDGAPASRGWVEAAIWDGEPRDIDLRTLAPTRLASALELIETPETISSASPAINDTGLTWNGLHVAWLKQPSTI